MKKVVLMMALVATLFAGCTNKDNEEDFNLAKQMLGKWMMTQFDGNTLPTNAKVVYTFESTTNGYMSASVLSNSLSQPMWTNHAPSRITVDGKTITMRGELSKTVTYEAVLEVKTISDGEMLADSRYIVYRNNEEMYNKSGTSRWTKVSKEYSSDILGIWEGSVTSGEGSEYDDGEPHRWEYLDNGTYVYYNLDDEQNWIPNANEYADYFVDGTLLCTRWKNIDDDEGREWWEIASISGGVMNWTALRKRTDGTTYTATFQMTKVQ